MYCDIQDSTAGLTGSGGTAFSGVYENCIDADPLFADTTNDDFHLTWANFPVPDSTKSLCIDAGDPAITDPDGTPNDIGALFFDQELGIPEALEPENITTNSFVAVWTSANVAVGYHLDVALDDAFTNLVIDNMEIVGDTTYLADGLDEATTYYYRVNSYNTLTTSAYSNTQTANTLSTDVEEPINNEIKIYTSNDQLIVTVNQNSISLGEIMVWSTLGQLLKNQRVYQGRNLIDIDAKNQMIIVTVIIDGRNYHKKVLWR